ncbi:MAG: M67 family metallopeptidase [Planctomycetes bacterium]|nr:M67 family metallopeptidase [Planctomycetota bacterium]
MQVDTERVQITHAALENLECHAVRGWPHECCGVLLGRSGTIVDAQPVRNTAAEAGRFAADELELMHAERAALALGLSLVGYFHSHPTGPPLPSLADRAGVLWPELPPFYHLIISPAGGWALYNTQDGCWSRLDVTVVASAG